MDDGSYDKNNKVNKQQGQEAGQQISGQSVIASVQNKEIGDAADNEKKVKMPVICQIVC
jgi:hypothetical protein